MEVGLSGRLAWSVRSRMKRYIMAGSFANAPRRGAGLGRERRLVGCRRPLGLRADGCGMLMMRRRLLMMVNRLRTGVRQGLKWKWTAVCEFLTPLGPPKGGNHPSAVAGICRPL